MTALLAIPGQPTEAAGRLPVGEVDRALSALAACAARLEAEHLFGFVDPLLVPWTSVDPMGRDVIHVQICNAALLTPRARPPVMVEHRWGVLAEREDWWVAGWHASHHVMALTPRGRRLLDDALNAPHKLHWPAARAARRRA